MEYALVISLLINIAQFYFLWKIAKGFLGYKNVIDEGIDNIHEVMNLKTREELNECGKKHGKA